MGETEQLIGSAIPDPDFLISIIQNMSYRAQHVLYEFLENSFDAKASVIKIHFDGKRLIVWDNGHGCADMAMMAKLGNHSALQPNKSGRYGIGFKEAAIWSCKRTYVTSRCDNFLYGADLNWGRMIERKSWDYYYYSREPSAGDSYTEIILDEIHPDRKSFPYVVKQYIPRTFLPALIKGKKIFYNGELIKPLALPHLEEIREAEGQFKGRPWKMRAGLMKEESRLWDPGHWVVFGNRIIIEHSKEGTFQFSGRRFFNVVEIFETPTSRWSLDRMKCGLVDDEKEFLESLFPHCRDLLEKGDSKSKDVHLSRISEEVSELLTLAMPGRNRIMEKRPGPKVETGTAEAANSGKSRARAVHSDPLHSGSVVGDSRTRGGKIRILFEHLPMPTLGKPPEIDSYKTVVVLNQDHPLISKNPDADQVAHAAIFLVANAWVIRKHPNLELFDVRNGKATQEFSDLVGKWLHAYQQAKTMESGSNAA